MMAIKTRKIGQEITAIVGGKPISPVTAVPGGQSRGITTDQQAELLSKAKEATELIEKGIESTVPLFTQYSDAIELLGPVESHFAALTNNGDLSYYEGNVKVIDSEGNPVTEFSPVDYLDYIEEKSNHGPI